MLTKRFSFFQLLLLVIIVFSFAVHLYALRSNNIFFTVDQGRDGVYVREILSRGRIFLKGPETNIRGIFAGPLYFYFVAFGYLLFGGHPLGGVVVMVILNLALTVSLVVWLRKVVGDVNALLVGGALQIYWPFYETSLWSFNPFPLVAVALVLIFLLINFLAGKTRYYFAGLFLILLAFNFEVAGAAALFLFYLLVGIYGVIKRLVSLKKFLYLGITVFAFAALFLGRQFLFSLTTQKVLGQSAGTTGGSGMQVFSGLGIKEVFEDFTNIVGRVASPDSLLLGLALFAVVVCLYIRSKKHNKKVYRFVVLTFILTAVSFIFFASNKGYRGWHVVYLPTLLFISFLLMLFELKKSLLRPLIVVILVFVVVSQASHFISKYNEYLKPSGNPSLMYNEIAAIDWIYTHSNQLGFKVYNYTDTFYDYPYQYLFYWYGLGKYGYLPDEYANYPLAARQLYVPGYEYYGEPKRSGEELKYLIIQSSTNGEDNTDWLVKFRQFHNLIESTGIGDIKVEKYLRVHDAPNDPCIWWGNCQVR